MKKFAIIVMLLVFDSCNNSKVDETEKMINQDVEGQKQEIVKKDFNSDDWKSSSYIERVDYIDSIINSNILIGKTKATIIDILGKNDGGFDSDNSIFYRLNINGVADIEFDYLLYIKFSDDYLVKSVTITD